MHVPVLLDEVLKYINAAGGKKFVDGTAGDGGHILPIVQQNPQAQVLGIDLDQTSLDNLRDLVSQKGLDQRIRLVQGNYKDLDKIIASEEFGLVDGIVLDLGFSSRQLDQADRGFSFQHSGPLDMRYDPAAPLTAAEVVNRYDVKKLETIIAEYGEDRFARRIAGRLVEQRKLKPIQTTLDLAEVIRKAIPPPLRFRANDNIRRVFQAIRIEVNHELENLQQFLPKAMACLATSGRLVVISFHSLEDRIVKEFFREQARDCVCPPEFPTCVCDKASDLRILTRKPVVPTAAEIESNPRSKPAKLRAAMKIKN